MNDLSTFELLPDEIFLEIYRYLLCSDILYSFMNLNQRFTRTLAHYRYHLTFHKTSIDKFHSICTTIIPQIGFQIRSLVLDCCYSVIQHPLFIRYFGDKMSLIFPNLERISLVSYQSEQLQAFLQTLNNLQSLVEIQLYSLFPIEESQQFSLTRVLFQANNRRLTTIIIDDHSSCLTFDTADRYLNIIRLQVKITSLTDLPNLFSAFPNVQSLHLTIKESETVPSEFIRSTLTPLVYLKDFEFHSFGRNWDFNELAHLLIALPNIEIFSLFLFGDDEPLIYGTLISSLFPSTLRQFHYAVHYTSYRSPEIDDEAIISSWSSYRIAYAQDDKDRFLHTIPWRFTQVHCLPLTNQIIGDEKHSMNGYDRSVEQVDLRLEKNAACGKSLAILSQCRRVRELIIGLQDKSEEKQTTISSLPRLSRLIQIWLYGLIPSDLSFFTMILKSAPNLFRLDLSYEHLSRVLENEQICQILSQRITSLAIFENDPNSSTITLKEEHLPRIASFFPKVQDIYVNLAHLIGKNSSDSVLICLLKSFEHHRMIGLCVDAEFCEQMTKDTERWLREKTVLSQRSFYAEYCNKLNRLLVWL